MSKDVNPPPTPPPPALVRAGVNAVTISWNWDSSAVCELQEIEVQHGRSLFGSWQSTRLPFAAAGGHVLTGLAAGTKYVCRCRVRGAGGWSEYSPKSVPLATLPAGNDSLPAAGQGGDRPQPRDEDERTPDSRVDGLSASPEDLAKALSVGERSLDCCTAALRGGLRFQRQAYLRRLKEMVQERDRAMKHSQRMQTNAETLCLELVFSRRACLGGRA